MTKHALAALLAGTCLLAGCSTVYQQNIDSTPIWQEDLAETGVHTEVSNAELLNTDPIKYSETRGTAGSYLLDRTAVMVKGQPVVTFYGVTAEDIKFVFLENIDFVYVDYDHTLPVQKIDYLRTDGDGWVSYKLDTYYNYEFTITTDDGTDSVIVVNRIGADIPSENAPTE